MNTDFLKDILDDPRPKASHKKSLRRYARAIDKMRSSLCIVHTWCKHDARNTTHEQIVGIIEATLDEVRELEDELRLTRARG